MLRDLHAEDPEGGYRVLADDLHDLGYEVSERRVWRPCKVQRMLGHASAAMTLDVYTDLFDDDLDAVAASLSAARLTALRDAS